MNTEVIPAPRRDPRVRRFDTATMRLARTMYADGDAWTPTQIHRYLRDRMGDDAPTVGTIREWVIPGESEHRRRRQNATYRARRKGRPSTTPILDRMRALKAVGVTYRGIAGVLSLDHGITIDPDNVRYYMNTGREPVRPKRRAGEATA